MDNGLGQSDISDENRVNKRKRKFTDCAKEDKEYDINEDLDESDSSGAPAPKYREIDNCYDAPSMENFSNEVLLEIFKYLDTRTLMTLMKCNHRFCNLALDRRFWHNIDVSQEILPSGILQDVLDLTQPNTQSIKLSGPPSSLHINGEFHRFTKTLSSIFTTCFELKILELQGVTIDFRHVKLVDFPKTVKRLILNDCLVTVPETVKSIFTGIDTHLTDLEELGIENCSWFEPYYMMIFSKVPKLRWLSLKGCVLLLEFVPYGSMAARFGFKKLEFLDLRFTPLNDSDLQCFNAIKTLKEIRIDCPKIFEEDEEILLETKSTEGKDISDDKNAQNNMEKLVETTIKSCLNGKTDDQIVEFDEILKGHNEMKKVETESEISANVTKAAQVIYDDEIPSTSSGSAANRRSQENATKDEPRAAVSASSPSTSKESFNLLHQEQSTSNSNTIGCSKYILRTPLFSSSSSSSSSSSLSSPPTRQSSVAPEESASDAANNSRSNGLPNLNDDVHWPAAGGNVPARCRFLPRPDQVIYLDLHNRRRIIMHGSGPRRPPNADAANNIDQVLNHPLFYDMINPLRRRGELFQHLPYFGVDMDAELAAARGQRRSRFIFPNYHSHRNQISDRGVCAFGRPQNNVELGVVWIRIGGGGNDQVDNNFERLTVRNYKLVTDYSLRHLVQCSPNLIFLDLSGTSVTQEGIRRFKEQKPQCDVIAEHLVESIS